MKILVINPGATSTKLAVFEDEKALFEMKVEHSEQELRQYGKIFDQYDYRLQTILKTLGDKGFDLSELDAVVGRGGLLKPIAGGTYAVNDQMIADLEKAVRGEHASNLGAVLAYNIAKEKGIPSFIVDPVAVDELEDVARISGLPEMERKSLLHALNHKAVARKVAQKMGKKYEEVNFIVAHLGTGISVAAHKKGRAVDLNDARGEGPFSPDRCGGLNAYEMMKLCYSGKLTEGQMKEKLSSQGGLFAYLGTKDIREAEAMAKDGNKQAELVLEAMAYQVAKEIGAQAAVLSGLVDTIILTGGIAYSKLIVEKISARVKFIAPVVVVPGEEELESLALGALRVLRGEEKERIYK